MLLLSLLFPLGLTFWYRKYMHNILWAENADEPGSKGELNGKPRFCDSASCSSPGTVREVRETCLASSYMENKRKQNKNTLRIYHLRYSQQETHNSLNRNILWWRECVTSNCAVSVQCGMINFHRLQRQKPRSQKKWTNQEQKLGRVWETAPCGRCCKGVFFKCQKPHQGSW